MGPRDRRDDAEDEEESEALLAAPALAASDPSARPTVDAEMSASPVDSSAARKPSASLVPTAVAEKDKSTSGAQLATAPSSGPALCRICLEEDSPENLDTPCACAGTQRHAHQQCIQRWVEEKGNLRCEICGQEYKGQYTAPPPRPAPEAAAVPLMPVFIVDPDNPTRVVIRRGTDIQMLDESLDSEYQRHPGLNFVFTACVFILFLVVLHHTMGATDGADGIDPTYDSSPPPPVMPDDDPSVADGFTFFLFWIFTKVLLIGIPLYTILRVAQRQAQHQQYEEMMRGAFDGNRRVVFRVHTVRGGEMPAHGINAV